MLYLHAPAPLFRPILLDGVVLGSAPPHAAHALARALRAAKCASNAVAAGLERVGAGPLPAQADAVAGLVAAALHGRMGEALPEAEGPVLPPATGK